MEITPVQSIGIERLYFAPAAPKDAIDGEAHSCSSHNDQGIDEFFQRNGFNHQMRTACDSFARTRFSGVEIRPAKSQGYCSYTLALSATHLLQFRPEAYKLDMKICEQARIVFGELVPQVEYLGGVTQNETQLHVYLQGKISGVNLAEFRRRRKDNGKYHEGCRRRLVEDLAGVFALSFKHQRLWKELGPSGTLEKGQVGASLQWRLGILQELPGRYLQEIVAKATSDAGRIESMPWCLTHGDLIPTNIMVDPVSGCLTGLIDWAEGEWLPFGIGLYGLEEVLGYDDHSTGFQLYDDHEELRGMFWDRFLDLTTVGTSDHSTLRKEARLSRILGILLWRGIAFNDGRIDRAFQAGRDDAELQKLNLLLNPGNPMNILE